MKEYIADLNGVKVTIEVLYIPSLEAEVFRPSYSPRR